MQKHTIQLFVQDGTWCAKFNDPEVLRLFGTDTLPTPYRFPGMDYLTVKAEIKRLNPDTAVGMKCRCRPPLAGHRYYSW